MRGLIFPALVIFICSLSTNFVFAIEDAAAPASGEGGGAKVCSVDDFPSKGVCSAVREMQKISDAYEAPYNDVKAKLDDPTKSCASVCSAETLACTDCQNALVEAKKIIAADCGEPKSGVVAQAVKSCENAADTSASMCAEKLSPNIQKGATLVKGAGALLGQVSGANDSCDGFADLMKNLGKAITAFEGACGGAKALAETTCGTSATKVMNCMQAAQEQSQLLSKSGAADAGKSVLALGNSAKAISAEATKVAKATEGYGLTLASAGAGLLSMANEGGKAKQCKDKTTANDCSKNPSAQGCGSAQTNFDCNGKDANSSVCLCAKNPRQTGCDKTLAGTQFGHLVDQKPGSNTDVAAPALPGAPGYNPDFSGSQPTAGSAGGGGGGGRPGFGGGGSASSGADKSKPSGKGSELMMGGGGYGGGGGGGYGRGGGGYAEGKYDKYLPGGQEANRSVAGAGEVTGKMGKSNWDKIHDRYRDNVPKLKVDGR